MTKAEAREYVLRVLAAETRHHIANGSGWLLHPLREDGISVDEGGQFSEVDIQRITRSVEEIADSLERQSRRLRASRERRQNRRR